MAKPKYTIAQQIDELRRELRMRKQVYPRLIAQNIADVKANQAKPRGITKYQANERYLRLEAAIASLMELQERKRPKTLFDASAYTKEEQIESTFKNPV